MFEDIDVEEIEAGLSKKEAAKKLREIFTKMIEHRPDEHLAWAKRVLTESTHTGPYLPRDSRDFGSIDRFMLATLSRYQEFTEDRHKQAMDTITALLCENNFKDLHPRHLVEFERSSALIFGLFLIMRCHLELIADHGRNIDADIHYARIQNMIEYYTNDAKRRRVGVISNVDDDGETDRQTVPQRRRNQRSGRRAERPQARQSKSRK